MNTSSTFKEQVRRNMVALISLAVAVTGLDRAFADADREAVSRKAWAKVLSIRDLAQISEGSDCFGVGRGAR